MPGLTITTDAARPAPTAPAPTHPTPADPRRPSVSSARTSSPPRPPISPITPPLAATQLPGPDPPAPTAHDFSRGRPVFTHTTQPDQRQHAPLAELPPAAPIDFDANPDVLALKSAISILQLQRARAAADIQHLSRAKAAALADPEAFVADLEAGRVQVGGGDPMFGGGGHQAEDDSEEDSDEDEEEEEDERFSEEVAGGQEATPESRTTTGAGVGSSDSDVAIGGNDTEALSRPQIKSAKEKRKKKQGIAGDHSSSIQPPPWQNLPKPQNVVRCPPINWAQYGVVGESLDKLHAEQLAAPTPGAPLVLGPGGTYEFTAGEQVTTTPAGSGVAEQPRRLVGVAAPYNPLRDKIDKKGKGGRR